MATSMEVSQSGQVVQNESTAKKINNLLNSSKTRLEGLNLLNEFLPRCSDEDFLSFCVGWMQNCYKSDGLTKNRSHSAQLLCNLLKTSSSYPELKKSVSFFITTRYFDFFFKHLLNSEAGWICTETCLCLYRGACGPFHETLQKHLMYEVEKNVNIPSVVARCFALLPSAGGGGNDSVNYKRNWRSQFAKFLKICHSLLNKLLLDVEEFQEDVALEQELETDTCDRSIEHLAIKFQNCCTVLGFMLLNQYPAPKSIPSDLVFQLICRGLALNPKALEKLTQTTDMVSLLKVLPEIQCALFSLLKALVVTCRNQLIPYSHLICKLIKQSLQWTESDVAYGTEKPFGRLRIFIYETMCNWLVVAGSGSCIEVIAEVVVSSAVSDVRSKKEVVFLKEAKPRNRAKRKEKTTRQIDVTANGQLCQAALRALQFLLKFGGVLLKPEAHKFVQEVTVKLLVEIQKSSPGDVLIPFSVPGCRLELYSLLLELIHQPCSKWPPPTNFGFRLFAEGVNDCSPEVSSFCSAALNYTTIIIHPQYDNGGFPPSDRPDSRVQVVDEGRGTEQSTDAVTEKVNSGTELSPGNDESFAKSDEAGPSKDANEGSDGFSSDEDSRNTIPFSKEITEPAREPLIPDESRKEEVEDVSSGVSPPEDSTAKPEITRENPTREKSPSPVGSSPSTGETPEKRKMRKLSESDHGHSADGKTVSPGSANEDACPKRRYFLRSKTPAPSESEESLKRTGSAESLRSTPGRSVGRMTPSAQNSAKRPRTRGASKSRINSESEEKTPGKSGHDDDDGDDEEDIRAAFDDSFVD